MIKDVKISSQFLRSNTYGMTSVYYNNSSQPMTGMLRYHSGGRMEVYDGHNWTEIGGTVDVSLHPAAEDAIQWALKKMEEERRLKDLMDRHPGLKDAHEKFEIMRILVTDEEQRQ